MNVDRILELADFIENSETYVEKQWNEQFGTELSLKRNPDGSPANLIGHGIALFREKYWNDFLDICEEHDIDSERSKETYQEVQLYLKLDIVETMKLFYRDPWLNPTKEETAETLRYLAKTGKVKWNDDDYYE